MYEKTMEIKFDYPKAVYIASRLQVLDVNREYRQRVGDSISQALSKSLQDFQSPDFIGQFSNMNDTVETQADIYASLFNGFCNDLSKRIEDIPLDKRVIDGVASFSDIKDKYASIYIAMATSMEGVKVGDYPLMVSYFIEKGDQERIDYKDAPQLSNLVTMYGIEFVKKFSNDHVLVTEIMAELAATIAEIISLRN